MGLSEPQALDPENMGIDRHLFALVS